ncbi:MAG TPA: hypothetical protein VJ770_28010 [Stellaceae bacterium]|nr:hypothetical protein [Stellaceae bacterium]
MAAVPFALRVAGAMLVAAVAGCSAAPYATAVAPVGPPWVTARSPDLVALRWYADQTPVVAAGDVAQAHCAAFGKVAVLVSDEQSGGAQMAQYDCR